MTFPLNAVIVPDGRPDTPDELAALETVTGPVPSPYRELLLTHGSFRFRGDASVNTPRGNKLPIFGCWGASGTHSIPELMEPLDGLQEAGFIAFADDEYGNPYAWSRKDGIIGYLDVEEGGVLYEVASSMQEFLDSITVEDD